MTSALEKSHRNIGEEEGAFALSYVSFPTSSSNWDVAPGVFVSFSHDAVQMPMDSNRAMARATRVCF